MRKFGRRVGGDGRRQRPMDLDRIGNSDGLSELMSLAGMTAMTCDNEGTTIGGDMTDEFDDFCFGGADDEDVAGERLKNGECPECGVQCFQVNEITGVKTPYNVPGSIEDGVCLLCLVSDPTNVTDIDGSNVQTACDDDGDVIVTHAEYRVEFRKVNSCTQHERCNSSPDKSSTKRPSFAGLGRMHRPSVSFGKGLKNLSVKHRELKARIVQAELELRPLTSEATTLSCLAELVNVLEKEVSLSNVAVVYGVVPAALAAMKKYKSNGKIQIKATMLLGLITQDEEEISLGMVACNQGVVILFESAMAHVNNRAVLRDVCYVLYRVSSLPRNAAEVVSNNSIGGVSFLLSLMNKYEGDEFISMYIVGVLYQISRMQISCLIQDDQLLGTVLRVMQNQKKSNDMQQVGCKLLHLLSSEGSLEVRTKLVQLDVIRLLLGSMKSCTSSEVVARQGMLTMTALVVSNTAARSQIVGKDGKGVSIILNCMKKHEHDVHVQTEGCRLIKFLCTGPTEGVTKSKLYKTPSKRRIIKKAQEKITKETGSLSNKLTIPM
jgi:hypothetical protein